MNAVILIVDDIAENRQLLASIIRKNTSYEILIAKSGTDVLAMLDGATLFPDLILLDIMMPKMDGLETARILKGKMETKDIPIIFITGLTDVDEKVKAFEAGAADYIAKPFNKHELLARVNAHLELKKMYDELKIKNELLEDQGVHLSYLVEEKTRKIDRLTITMISALENVNLYNDNNTGNHLKRVSTYSSVLAEKYGMDHDFVKKIKIYASLHDVGKVGIPDRLLKKPGKYTPEEFESMKEHVVIGHKMLDSSEIDVMAKNIALYHHEKWNGFGYVHGLQGEKIPIEARIVALADVYDALTTKRPYKDVISEDETDKIISGESGKHFDPEIAKVFFENKDLFIDIKKSL